jgi:hypothetical protein
MNEKRVSKADFAAAIDVSKGRVTQLVAKGLPAVGDKIPLERAKRWYQNNIRTCATKRGPKPKRQAEIPSGGDDLSGCWRQVLDTILAARGVIPDLALKLGCRDMAVVITLYEGFATMVLELAGELTDCAYDWGVDDIPWVEIDWPGLAEKYGLSYAPESQARADELVDRLFRLLDPGTQLLSDTAATAATKGRTK